MLASSSLLKQVTEQSLALKLRLDIWTYLINYLATRVPELQPFVTVSLIQLLCRVTKFGCFDDDRFWDLVKESMNFLSQAIPGHYAIGLKIISQLISEMNQANVGMAATNHRRVACSFRDQYLFQIFQISLTSLGQLKNDVGNQLQELAIALSMKCLSFDFVGTSVDESSDELDTVQIPSPWKPVLEDSLTLQIFFDYYAITKPPLSKEVFVSLESTPDAVFQTDAVRYALIGLVRDLIGIAMATNSRRTYGFLFDWLYPAHMPLLLKGISHWTDTPEVMDCPADG